MNLLPKPSLMSYLYTLKIISNDYHDLLISFYFICLYDLQGSQQFSLNLIGHSIRLAANLVYIS